MLRSSHINNLEVVVSKRPTRATKSTAATAETTASPETAKPARAARSAAKASTAKATVASAPVETVVIPAPAVVIPAPAEVDLRSSADRSDEIARAAYLLWEKGTPGTDEELWLTAERSVLQG